MDAVRAQTLVESYIEAYNGLDVAGMLAPLHPEVVFEHSANGSVTLRTEGKVAFEAQAEQAIGWFMERTQQVEAFRFQGDHAEVAINYLAITAVDLPNGLKAGTMLQLKGQSIFTFRAGLIVSITDIS